MSGITPGFIVRIGLDLAKRVIQVHAIDATGRVVVAEDAANELPASMRMALQQAHRSWFPRCSTRECRLSAHSLLLKDVVGRPLPSDPVHDQSGGGGKGDGSLEASGHDPPTATPRSVVSACSRTIHAQSTSSCALSSTGRATPFRQGRR